MRPTLPNLLNLQSEHLHSKFRPRSAHSLERFVVILSCQIDEFLINPSLKSDAVDVMSVPEVRMTVTRQSPNKTYSV